MSVLAYSLRVTAYLFLVLGLFAPPALSYELSKSQRNTVALDTAFARLDQASRVFASSARSCGGGPTAFRCLERAEATWGGAWFQFEADLTHISFPDSQVAKAAAVESDASKIANDLFAASDAKNPAAHTAAFQRVVAEVRRFSSDAHAAFGIRP